MKEDSEANTEGTHINAINQDDFLSDVKEFFEVNRKEIGKIAKAGEKIVSVNFEDFSAHSPELAGNLIDRPEETIQLLEVALEELEWAPNNARVRFTSISHQQELFIRNIRSKHLGKMIAIEGIVRQSSEVRPLVTNAKFECPSCGTIISVLQIEKKFKEPSRCSCGRRGGFKEISKDMVDAQVLVIEEASDNLHGGEQPKRMTIFLKEDLVDPHMEMRTTPGSRVKIIGILKEIAISSSSGAMLTRFDLAIETNNIIPLDESFEDVDIDEEDERAIKELAANPEFMERMVDSIAPSIWGHRNVKKALAFQLFGGVKKLRSDGTKMRGDIHVLLVGDPGVAKSVMLGFIAGVAPKARYISGKSTTGAGLTAAVVKDDILKGWGLEAGAMVLANKGIVCVDEFDKMNDDDRSTMHEAMEQQCYHYDTELQFADGSSEKIGKYVESMFEQNKNKIMKGVDCEILDVKSKELFTTDFDKIGTVVPQKISRHIAPKEYYKIVYGNGREVVVTPEHPIFVYKDNQVKEISAALVKEGMLVPSPRHIKVKGRMQKLTSVKLTHWNNKTISFPDVLDSSFAELLGLHASEGHSYYSCKNRYAEIGICNTDKNVVDNVFKLFGDIFKTHINLNISKAENRKRATKDLYTIRCSSIPLYRFFEVNFPELLLKAPQKRIPQIIKKSRIEEKVSFLKGFFAGDGFVDSERCGFSTSSIKLAEDLQDLLLNLNIWTYIATERRGLKKYYKVVVSGEENLEEFLKLVRDTRIKRITYFLERSKKKAQARDVVPYEFVVSFNDFLKKVHVSDGYFCAHMEKGQNSHRKVCLKYLKKAQDKLKITKDRDLIKLAVEFEKFLTSDIKFIRIKNVKKIRDKKYNWVYDVSVPPTKTFISQGLVLHNTITISKATVQATLHSQTSVLAAANPKFGRFDPLQSIPKQINLSPSLLSRFDVIFIIRDIPGRKNDEAIATHVLSGHKQEVHYNIIDKSLLKKYISYAKQKYNPVLTDEAIKIMKDFYVGLRNIPQIGDGPSKPIPIGARQLEAIVRLAEAHARMRLAKEIGVRDATAAIDLVKSYLMQVGYDKDTKTFDIDKITGNPASARNKIRVIQDAIEELEKRVGKRIPLEELNKYLEGKMKQSEIDEAVGKLLSSGDLFRPKRGFIGQTR